MVKRQKLRKRKNWSQNEWNWEKNRHTEKNKENERKLKSKWKKLWEIIGNLKEGERNEEKESEIERNEEKESEIERNEKKESKIEGNSWWKPWKFVKLIKKKFPIHPKKHRDYGYKFFFLLLIKQYKKEKKTTTTNWTKTEVIIF